RRKPRLGDRNQPTLDHILRGPACAGADEPGRRHAAGRDGEGNPRPHLVRRPDSIPRGRNGRRYVSSTPRAPKSAPRVCCPLGAVNFPIDNLAKSVKNLAYRDHWLPFRKETPMHWRSLTVLTTLALVAMAAVTDPAGARPEDKPASAPTSESFIKELWAASDL